MKSIVRACLLFAALCAQVSVATPPSNPTWHLIHRSDGMTVYLGPDGKKQQAVLIVYDEPQRDPRSGALYQSSVMHLSIICPYPGGPAVLDGWDAYYDSANLDAISVNPGPHMAGTSVQPNGPGLQVPPPNSLLALIATTACLKWEAEQPAPAPPSTATQLEQQRKTQNAAAQAAQMAEQQAAERAARQKEAVEWFRQRNRATCVQKLSKMSRSPGEDSLESQITHFCDSPGKNEVDPVLATAEYCEYMRSSDQSESVINAACDTTSKGLSRP